MTRSPDQRADEAWSRFERARRTGDHAGVLESVVEYLRVQRWVYEPEDVVPAVRRATDAVLDADESGTRALVVRALCSVGSGIPDPDSEAGGELLRRAYELGRDRDGEARAWAGSALVSLGLREEKLGNRERAEELYSEAMDLVEDLDSRSAKGVRSRALSLLVEDRTVYKDVEATG